MFLRQRERFLQVLEHMRPAIFYFICHYISCEKTSTLQAHQCRPVCVRRGESGAVVSVTAQPSSLTSLQTQCVPSFFSMRTNDLIFETFKMKLSAEQIRIRHLSETALKHFLSVPNKNEQQANYLMRFV